MELNGSFVTWYHVWMLQVKYRWLLNSLTHMYNNVD